MNSQLRFKLTLACLSAVLSMSGCTPSQPKPGSGPTAQGSGNEKKLVVGFSQCGSESSWRTAETKSIQEEAAKRGIDLRFDDARGKQEEQFKALNSFVAQNVDAIILAPKVKTGWDSVLEKVKKKGIPVILVDRGISVEDDSLYVTLIASDFVDEGKRAALWLAKQTGGKAKIVELEGEPGADPTIERKKGFHDAIAAYPDMKIIQSQTGNFNLAEGKAAMEAILKSKGNEIQAVYAHNDDMALGAIQAIEEAGKKPGKDILVVSIDGVKGAFEAIIEGKLNCSIECNPLLGPNAFDAVKKAVTGEKLPKKSIVEDELFDQSNAKNLIGGRKY